MRVRTMKYLFPIIAFTSSFAFANCSLPIHVQNDTSKDLTLVKLTPVSGSKFDSTNAKSGNIAPKDRAYLGKFDPAKCGPAGSWLTGFDMTLQSETGVCTIHRSANGVSSDKLKQRCTGNLAIRLDFHTFFISDKIFY